MMQSESTIKDGVRQHTLLLCRRSSAIAGCKVSTERRALCLYCSLRRTHSPATLSMLSARPCPLRRCPHSRNASRAQRFASARSDFADRRRLRGVDRKSLTVMLNGPIYPFGVFLSCSR